MSIYSKVYQKLSKVPETVSYALIIVSSFLVAIGMVLQFDEAAFLLEETPIDIQFNPDVFKWISWVFGGFMNWGVMELIIGFVFSYVYKYRAIDSQRKAEFKSVIRIFCAVKQFIMGAYEFVFLASPEAYFYGVNILGIVTNVVIFTFAYLVLKSSILNKKKIFTVYSKLYKFYFIIATVFNVLELIGLVTISPIPVMDVVMTAVCLAVIGLGALGCYFLVYKKVKIEEEENKKEPEIIFVDNNNGNPPPEIFSGYGF